MRVRCSEIPIKCGTHDVRLQHPARVECKTVSLARKIENVEAGNHSTFKAFIGRGLASRWLMIPTIILLYSYRLMGKRTVKLFVLPTAVVQYILFVFRCAYVYITSVRIITRTESDAGRNGFFPCPLRRTILYRHAFDRRIWLVRQSVFKSKIILFTFIVSYTNSR